MLHSVFAASVCRRRRRRRCVKLSFPRQMKGGTFLCMPARDGKEDEDDDDGPHRVSKVRLFRIGGSIVTTPMYQYLYAFRYILKCPAFQNIRGVVKCTYVISFLFCVGENNIDFMIFDC